MVNDMKKSLLIGLIVAESLISHGGGIVYSEQKNGLIWEYTLEGKDAVIYSCKRVTSSYYEPLTTAEPWGEVVIPATLNEKVVIGIGDYVFAGCEMLTAVVMPDTVRNIGKGAFRGCEVLWKFTIPNGVANIRADTFQYCSGLSKISIPNSVVSIEDEAFQNCGNLSEVEWSCGITNIGNRAFQNCVKIDNVQFFDGLVGIGENAFEHCEHIATVSIPQSAMYLGTKAFSFCTNLTVVSVHSADIQIGGDIFQGCTLVGAIEIPLTYPIRGEWGLGGSKDAFRTVKITDGTKDIVPFALGGFDGGCGKLESIEIPPSVVSIGNNAFRSCCSLAEICLPIKSKVSTIGYNAFYGCTSLTNAFLVSDASSVDIGKDAFCGCQQLVRAVLPANLTSVSEGMFSGCESLTSVFVPNGVTSVGNSAFANCKNLSLIVLSEALQSIGDYAFSGCESLGMISIPSMVLHLGSEAFANCSKLLTVNYRGDAPGFCGTGLYAGTPMRLKSCVPFDSIGWATAATTELPNVWNERGIEHGDWSVDAPMPPSVVVVTNYVEEVVWKTNAVDVIETNYVEKVVWKTNVVDVIETNYVEQVIWKTNVVDVIETNHIEIVRQQGPVAEAVNAMEQTFETATSTHCRWWGEDTTVSHDGTASLRSADIGNNESAEMKTAVEGCGTVLYWWKASCESDEQRMYRRDHGVFLIDGEECAKIDGGESGSMGDESDWILVRVKIETACRHELIWRYVKDADGKAGADSIWIDEFTWIPADGTAVTKKNDIPVPYTWLDEHGLLEEHNPETAALQKSGKVDGAGRELTVADEFVAGTNPNDPTDDFKAKIEIVNGKPIVTWEPDLNEGGKKDLRLYKIYGMKNLDGSDSWTDMENVSEPEKDLFKFFKVNVEMPHREEDVEGGGTEGGGTEGGNTGGDNDGLYMIINLSESATDANRVTYIDAVPEGGWSDEYKTSKIVLRKIEPGSFRMAKQADVTISRPYYIGVFEVTQRQWELVVGNRPSYFSNDAYYATRPVEQVSFEMIRGSKDGTKWPISSSVDDGSFMALIRKITNLTIDLPTEAQWEFACRAGATTDYNNGTNCDNIYQNANMNVLGRYYGNGGASSSYDSDVSHGTAAVGSYLQNAWGLYDMHGNVLEWCLDWEGDLVGGTDPVGPETGSVRMQRGGSWGGYADWQTSFCRATCYTYPITYSDKCAGFRLVLVK